MRMLFIIDGYPPVNNGGFAQLCYDLAHEIRDHGHHVTVLCTGLTSAQPDIEQVIRRLTVPVGWGHHWPVPVQQVFLMASRSRHNLRVFDQALAEVRPEAILLWPTEYLDQNLMAAAESLPDSVTAYYIAGVSPTDHTIIEQYWANPGRSMIARLVKRPLRPILGRDRRDRRPLRLPHVLCVSDYERRRVVAAGVPADNVHVVHNGIDPEPFRRAAAQRIGRGKVLRLVYTGSLVAHKGVHTAIEALGLLKTRGELEGLHLDIVGGGHPDYEAELQTRVRALSVGSHVTFRGRVPRTDIPHVLAGHDVFLFTSVYEEPIARSVMEAMAAGLAVIGTPVGGQAEMLTHNVNALVYHPNDAEALAAHISTLLQDSALCERLANAGQCMVLERFTLDRMVDEMEARLEEITG